MSAQHHGELQEARDRLLDQFMGADRRAFPAGKMGADDEGELSYALANDDKNRVIVMRFGKPVEWIGLDVASATELRDQLTERIMALRGIK